MGLFGAAHGWRGEKAGSPNTHHAYPTMLKLATIIPYLKKIQKIYKERDTPIDFC